MTDKNNRTMKTGDVVEITGAYFKNDNGLYFVEHTPRRSELERPGSLPPAHQAQRRVEHRKR